MARTDLELKPGNKAMVFFFGTYDKGQVLMKDMWLYNEESKAKYAPANGKRPKKFQQALEEIVDWPDMLPYEGKSVVIQFQSDYYILY